MLHLNHHLHKPFSTKIPRFTLQPYSTSKTLPFSSAANKFPSFTKTTLIFTPKCAHQSAYSYPETANKLTENKNEVQEKDKKNFWGAVSLIIGTAVGPGMLGLPAATMKSGSLPSTITILLCWVYVISSIILVAELTFSAMEEDNAEEVSFTSLATKALGTQFGAFVALVYASLSFALLVACVSGIASVVSQWFPWMNLVLANASFPLAAGIIIGFFPFKAIDSVNRFLCLLMLFSITALVVVGSSLARTNILGSFARSSWQISEILPSIPVIVLTLGFHVITPFICKIAGNTIHEARKAVLIGGAVPLIMVLSWNLIVLGLAGATSVAYSNDPIAILLSVNPSALSAIQGFAFSALATSFIGYAVSFPKQLIDTLGLIFTQVKAGKHISNQSETFSNVLGSGRVGSVTFSSKHFRGNAGRALFDGSKCLAASEVEIRSSNVADLNIHKLVTMMVLGVPILIGSFYRSTFSTALDFAGVYANCFLFGILPPAMAYMQKSRKKLRSSSLPGGDVTLLLLFSIAVILGIWH